MPNLHSPLHQAQLFGEAVFKMGRVEYYNDACEQWRRNGNLPRLAETPRLVPDVDIEMPGIELGEFINADDLNMMNMIDHLDGSLDTLNGSWDMLNVALLN